MADDVGSLYRALGQVEAAIEAVKEQNADIKSHLRRQDQAHEARDARDEARFKVLDEKTTLTGARVSLLEKVFEAEVKPVVAWQHDEGAKLDGRVSLLEQAKAIEAAEKVQAEKLKAGQEGEERGSARTWAFIGAVGTVMGGILGALFTYGKDALDFLKGLQHG